MQEKESKLFKSIWEGEKWNLITTDLNKCVANNHLNIIPCYNNKIIANLLIINIFVWIFVCILIDNILKQTSQIIILFLWIFFYQRIDMFFFVIFLIFNLSRTVCEVKNVCYLKLEFWTKTYPIVFHLFFYFLFFYFKWILISCIYSN